MMFQTAFHWVALVGVLAVPVAAQPPNDSCSSAEMLTLQSDGTARVTGTTIGASLDGPAFCGVSNTSPGVRECDLTLTVAVAFVHKTGLLTRSSLPSLGVVQVREDRPCSDHGLYL